MKGWIYICRNLDLPGMVKIGFSMKDPKLRVNDFNNAGLPSEHELVFSALVENPRNLEQLTHKNLKDFRYKKEWFKCSVETAINEIKSNCQNIHFEEIQQSEFQKATQDSSHVLNNSLCDYSYYMNCKSTVSRTYKGKNLCEFHYKEERKERFRNLK